MHPSLVFLANQSVPKHVRERLLRELREAGFRPKPLVADPIQRCHALLEFLRRAEKDGPALFLCLDDAEAILARIVAGHVHGAVLAVIHGNEVNRFGPREENAEAPLAILASSTPESVVRWLSKIVSPTEASVPAEADAWKTEPTEARRGRARSKFSEEDAEWLERLANDFRPRLREEVRKPAGIVKQPSLDFSHELRQIISRARNLAHERQHASVTPLHYLAAIAEFRECAGNELLRAMDIALEALVDRVLASLPPGDVQPVATFAPSEEATELVAHSKRIARSRSRRSLTTVDFLEGMAQQSDSLAAAILAEFGVTADKIAVRLAELSLREEMLPNEPEPDKAAASPPPVEIDVEQVKALQEKLASKQRGYAAATEKHETNPEPVILKSKPPSEPPGKEGKPLRAECVSSDKMDWNEKDTKTPLVLKCDPQNPPLDVIEEAADSLLEGKLVAFPTETVYGLGVDATNVAALERLYEVKGRERTRAIALLIHSITQLRYVVKEIPEGVPALMEKFWPGPLTIVFRRHPNVFASLAPDDSIGIRMPDHYVALAILSMVGRPIATTSANLSGQPAARVAEEIVAQLGTNVHVIVDAGRSGDQPASTVLSVVEKPYRILRPGPISRQQLEEVANVPILD